MPIDMEHAAPRGDVMFDPNGWDPTPEDIEAMAVQADIVLSDGTVAPMDQTLLAYAASRIEHEGGIGTETYKRTVATYEAIIAQADQDAIALADVYVGAAMTPDEPSDATPSQVDGFAIELVDDVATDAMHPADANDAAIAQVYSELLEKASLALTARNGETT